MTLDPDAGPGPAPRPVTAASWPTLGAVTSAHPHVEDGGRDALSAIADAVLGAGPHVTVDLLDLLERPVAEPVDVVRAGDDLLPRLAHQRVLRLALTRAARALRPGGLLLAPVPELDRLRGLRPAGPPPRVAGHG